MCEFVSHKICSSHCAIEQGRGVGVGGNGAVMRHFGKDFDQNAAFTWANAGH